MKFLNSSLCSCEVSHRRYEGADHSFKYKLNLFCIDLEELPLLNQGYYPTGYNRPQVYSIYDKDYLYIGNSSISKKLQKLFQEYGFEKQCTKIKKILLITAPRYFGYVFNPVSFYFCLDENEKIILFVAEINNTFGDKHVYILDEMDSTAVHKAVRQKSFHVSPFHTMQGDYHFSVNKSGDTFSINIDIFRKEQRIFSSYLTGNMRHINRKQVLMLIAFSPFKPWLTMPRILWQAFKLHYVKRLPVYKRPNPSSIQTLRHRPPKLFEKLFMKAVFRLLSRLKIGTLVMDLPDGSYRIFQGEFQRFRRVRIDVKNYGFFKKIVLGGDIGFGEAYEHAQWDSPDVVNLLRLLSDNRKDVNPRNNFLGMLGRCLNRNSHLRRNNSQMGSKRNIKEHYDLSNDFFRLFLDDSMMYSSGYFTSPSATLFESQQAKISKLIESANIAVGQRILEIGCGWGAFAIAIAKQADVHVTGVTISRQQYEYATQRVLDEGLQDKVTILLQDYRNITGEFNRIVSIEMLEAVGEDHLPDFFKQCNSLMAPEGLLILQVITMAENRIGVYRKSCDWIQKYIFPGCYVPSISDVSANAAHAELLLSSSENIGFHYAKTLAMWHEKFITARDKVLELGFSENFIRKWSYYFSYCEAGFANQDIGTYQFVLRSRNNRTHANPFNQSMQLTEVSARSHHGG